MPKTATQRQSPRKPAAPTTDEPCADPMHAAPGDPDFMTSLARGLTVIGAFTRQRRQLTIAQISQRTGIPRAAVRRCLHTLAKLGYVGSEDRRAFYLRPRILELGHAYMTSSPLASSSQPVLDRVSDVVHESCSMAILDGDEILYIARSSTKDRIMSIDLGLGSRLPAHCTSMGRVLLAGLAADELRAYLARVRIIAYTNRTVTSTAKLEQVIHGVRRSGYAIVDQELEIGLRSLAVPVRDHVGRTAAAINVGVQASRVPMSDLEARVLPELRAAAQELGMLLSV
jgi:IclR family pca regulon transcriptional regulator